MNKNKTYPDEYKLTRSFMTKVAFLLILGLLISIWFEYDKEFSWIIHCLSFIVIYCLFMLIQDVEYAIFNHKGVLIVNTKRWGKNRRKEEFYIDWKDVKYIRFTTTHSPAIDIVSIPFGRGYYNGTLLPYGKFASLAKYYSGREDILYGDYKKKIKAKRKKPGLYEKDW